MFSRPTLNQMFLPSSLFLPQERQRLETILNLCAEYNKGENVVGDPLGSGRAGFPGGLADGRRPSLENLLGGMSSSATLRQAQRLRESDDENLKEECSSTESTHQEVRSSAAPSAASALLNGDRQVRDNACLPPLMLCLLTCSIYKKKNRNSHSLKISQTMNIIFLKIENCNFGAKYCLNPHDFCSTCTPPVH